MGFLDAIPGDSLSDWSKTKEAAMQVALTGAVGFIGSHILSELQDHDHEVTALVRDETRRRPSAPEALRRRSSISTTDRRSWPCCTVSAEWFTPPARVTPPARIW